MSPIVLFLFGFAAGSVPLVCFMVWYYRHARRRVRSIQAAIDRYRAATQTVGGACDKAYRNS